MTENFEAVAPYTLTVGDEISYRDYAAYRAGDRYRRGTVIEINKVSRDGHKDPMIVGIRLENGRTTYPELLPQGEVRRYTA